MIRTRHPTNIAFVAAALLPVIANAEAPDARDRALWDSRIRPYLQRPLWQDATAYNASRLLMAPLHAAFRLNESGWQKEFAEHFARLAAGGSASLTRTRLDRLQYLYLASRFVAVAAESGKRTLIPEALPELLDRTVYSYWLEKPAPNWAGGALAGGLRERVEWKLSHRWTSPSYYRAIDSEELFVFAIAADLRAFERVTGKRLPHDSAHAEIVDTARQAYRQRAVTQPGGGILFQAGVWADHPDFAYAGHKAVATGLDGRKVRTVAEDSSHSDKQPLYLTSLAGAYPPGDPKRAYFLDLRARLEKQFFDSVLTPPSAGFAGFRASNFMDGGNGVYRYQYSAQAPGYGPYGLSGTLLLGWWSFLDTPRIRAMYKQMASLFPLSPALSAAYAPQSRDGGYSELCTRLAAKQP